MKMRTKLTKTAVFAASVSQLAQAGFTANDLYLGFSQSSATSDYIIDLGQPTALGLGGSSVMDISGDFSLATFNSVFTGGANGVNMAIIGGNNAPVFGVFATQVRSGGSGDPAVAGSSITATHSTSQMSGGAASITAIGALAGGLPTAGNYLLDPNKTYTAAVATGVQNNFIGKTGVIPFGTFDISSILYLDLYHATVSSPYTYLGYFTFDLSTSSPKFTFTPSGAASSAVPPPPPYLLLGRSGSVTTISFGTTNGATYNLHYTNSAGVSAPVSTWSVLPSTITGDGSTNSFTDSTTDTDRVYRVGAH